MMTKLHNTLEAVWYAAGPAQYLLYGIWTVVISGNFQMDGWHALFPAAWKMLGFAIIVITIWGSMRIKQYAILLNTFMALIVGAIYTSCAMMVGAEVGAKNIDLLRGSTQSQYMALLLLIVWGFYLANLISRQRMEFGRAGIDDA